jgi:pteridine reductase
MTATPSWAVVTGASARGGAAIAQGLHARGLSVVLHHTGRSDHAEALAAGLNHQRPGSALAWACDFTRPDTFDPGPLAGLPVSVAVCAASAYTPSRLGDEAAALADLQVHVLGHARLLNLLEPGLASVVAVADIHVARPAPGYLWYTVAKASLQTLVLTLAVEWAPRVRCNVVQPGTLPYPPGWNDTARRAAIEASIPMRRTGSFGELADAVTWLALDARYITGQVLAVDGGRSIWLP